MTRAWINFRRMQSSGLVAGVLIYAGAALHAWQALPGPEDLKRQRILLFPAIFVVLTVAAAQTVPPMRRWVRDYVWMSFRAGFGQSWPSVVIALGLLAGAAMFIYWQWAAATHGGRYPAGVFSGYAAGIGILIAQVLATRALERDPAVRNFIEGA